jgi:ATP-binding cassette subfamily B protein
MQQAYFSWSAIRGSQASLQDALELLNQPMPEYAIQPVRYPIAFERNISLNQLAFRYGMQSPYVFQHINLKVTKGSRIGFIGTTGSGKSTLLDVVMGLLIPTDGYLEVDDQVITNSNRRAWQAHIAHVPQAIFLADSTIEENIAFGVPKDEIDHNRVLQAAKQAKIAEIIESWPDQYETFVGERGIRLSGGQRQRIGIARALYKKADVIIFDEATSALDNHTELEVMQEIESLGENLTILIIAHRLSTLRNCSQIFELGAGRIIRVGSYQDIVNQTEL